MLLTHSWRRRLIHCVLLPVLALLMLSGCSAAGEGASVLGGDATMRHATLLKMRDAGDVTLVEVRDPWSHDTTTVLHRYLLVPAGGQVPAAWRDLAATTISVPLRHAVVMSSVHAALAIEVDSAGQGTCQMAQGIAAVADTAYVVRPDLKAMLRDGRWRDAGSSVNADVERLLALHPDALLLSPMQNVGHGLFETVGVPIVECADYMETTPLGRAEWMRFYTRLFGCGAVGDTLFAAVERDYCAAVATRDEAAGAAPRPKLLVDMRQGSSWHVPGGRSYLATLYADAGAAYFMANDTSAGSIPLQPERVLREAADADLWLIKYGAPTPLDYAALAAADSRYTQFRPYAARRIYVCNTLTTPYYEDIPFRPDRLLRHLRALITAPITPSPSTAPSTPAPSTPAPSTAPSTPAYYVPMAESLSPM